MTSHRPPLLLVPYDTKLGQRTAKVNVREMSVAPLPELASESRCRRGTPEHQDQRVLDRTCSHRRLPMTSARSVIRDRRAAVDQALPPDGRGQFPSIIARPGTTVKHSRSRSRGASDSVRIDNKDRRYAGLFAKPSDGLEPPTPLYEGGPWVKSRVGLGAAGGVRVPSVAHLSIASSVGGQGWMGGSLPSSPNGRCERAPVRPALSRRTVESRGTTRHYGSTYSIRGGGTETVPPTVATNLSGIASVPPEPSSPVAATSAAAAS